MTQNHTEQLEEAVTSTVEEAASSIDGQEDPDKRSSVVPSEVEVGKVEKIAEQAAEKAVRVAIRQEVFSGPLPRPQSLAAYEAIYPGAAAAIFKEFSENGQHLRECQKLGLQGAIDNDSRGQYMAFGLAILALGCAMISLFKGHPAVATAFITLTGAGIIAPFLNSNSKSKREKSEKDEEKEQQTAELEDKSNS